MMIVDEEKATDVLMQLSHHFQVLYDMTNRLKS